MTAQFRYEAADYTAARWAWMRHHPGRMALRFWYPILLVAGAAVALARRPGLWAYELSFVGIGVAFFLFISWTMSRTWSRQFKKSQQWQESMTADVDGQGVNLAGETFHRMHAWSDITQIYEEHRVFLFEKSGQQYLFLPKAAMNAAQMDELRGIITANAQCRVDVASSVA